MIKNVILVSLFWGQIITGFQTGQKQVALTFDACETKTPAHFDHKLLDYIVQNKLPATLFLSGKFIERNRSDAQNLSRFDFIDIENHSYSHRDLRTASADSIRSDVERNGKLIESVTGRKPRFFRFPYGYYDTASLKAVEKLGYRVVHWDLPSGDPDKKLTKEALVRGVLANTKPGTIHIFHINGRGWKTAEALPEIVSTLRSRGYEFILLRDAIAN